MNFLKPSENYQGRSKTWVIYPVVFLAVAAVGSAAFFYTKYNNVKDVANQPTENQSTIAAVEKLILLPKDEQPTIATVTDPEKLKEQSFFAHAKVGDKVLIFTKAKKAILYSPTENKLIEVAPLNLDDPNQSAVSGTGTTAE